MSEATYSLDRAIRSISAEEAQPLRHRVLRPGRPPEHSVYDSDRDPHTFHLGCFQSETLLGVASFTLTLHPDFEDALQYQLRGMAVDSVHHGGGHGRALLEHGMELLRARECSLLWCKARAIAVPFYEKLGFLPHGEWYDTPLSGMHLQMYRRL